jgi:CO dehydrogenase nickel-insertion accessory protein CooC1
LLAQLEDKPGRVVLVDLGGGVMTVARGDKSEIDALVVVVEPYPRSAEVGRRLLKMAEDKGITRRIVVANKVAGDEDLQIIRDLLGVEPDIVLPDDASVRAADREGASPVDHDPQSPALGKLRDLALSLV